VTHLGQRLSALIDGELDVTERERVLIHMARCGACRDEAAALRMLKRRMNALGEAAAGAAGLTGLTGRLMGLSDLALRDGMMPAEAAWPAPPPPGGWQAPERRSKPDLRAGRYFLAGSVAVFLAGLGTAAFIAGGEPQARAPAPPVTPSVDVLMVPHANLNGLVPDVRQRRDSLRPPPDADYRQGPGSIQTYSARLP
jgi:anti-sigma factor RsiW